MASTVSPQVTHVARTRVVSAWVVVAWALAGTSTVGCSRTPDDAGPAGGGGGTTGDGGADARCDPTGVWIVEHGDTRTPSPITMTLSATPHGGLDLNVEGYDDHPSCLCHPESAILDARRCEVRIAAASSSLYDDGFLAECETTASFELSLVITGDAAAGELTGTFYARSCDDPEGPERDVPVAATARRLSD